jgi:hypothetical protein
MAADMMKVEVDPTCLPAQLDPIEQFLEGDRQLRIRRAETWRRLARQATVAEEEAKGVGIHRHIAMRKLDRGLQQRQFEAVLVCGSKPADHLPRFNHVTRLPTAAIIRSEDVPQVFSAAESRRAVLGPQPKDLLATLRVHAEDGSWQAVRPYDQIADLQAPDRPES